MPAPKRTEPTNLNEWFGRKIRDLREALGWTQAKLGEEVRLSGSRIAQFERAEDVPPRDIVELLAEVLPDGGILLEVHPFLKRAWYKKWPEEIADVEAQARKIQQFSFVAPGLLQTEEYAAAILGSGTAFFGGDLNEKVAARMARQAVLSSETQPWLWCIMDESALYRRVCSREGMRNQLLHLLKMAEQPRIRLQVLPFSENRVVVSEAGRVLLWTLADGRIAAFRDDYEDGCFVTNPKKVSQLVNYYDQLHADSLSTHASMDFIHKVIQDQYS
ncbi:helix-turn-helix domain-containing protein [Streptomyces caatingaensis]|uniref:HTH cro/C1-type domain-containing protein n=1 Tax=Streptomyces caatingaensis TaxID=1678637 RepID=A0A0K9X8M4_9ACTN|nr:helix-turn-helix transcriptional regulator [Streptomyces caatingaensis]KNB49774.1 hypothetical protein AC230_23640 [Streptomyces caatingaensis]